MQSINFSDSKPIRELKLEYKKKQKKIQSRLEEFQTFYDQPVSWFFDNNNMQLKPVQTSDDHRIFEELCFCILTANTSAEMGMKSIDTIRNLLPNASMEEMKQALEGIYRFKTLRPSYIEHTRTYLEQEHNFQVKEIIESLKHNPDELRDFFAQNQGIKGLSFKEASHFLRNIGVSGYAILDKHILMSLLDLRVIEGIKLPLTPEKYKEIEKKMIMFSNQINIPMDELDLLLWSMKTNKILK